MHDEYLMKRTSSN